MIMRPSDRAFQRAFLWLTACEMALWTANGAWSQEALPWPSAGQQFVAPRPAWVDDLPNIPPVKPRIQRIPSVVGSAALPSESGHPVENGFGVDSMQTAWGCNCDQNPWATARVSITGLRPVRPEPTLYPPESEAALINFSQPLPEPEFIPLPEMAMDEGLPADGSYYDAGCCHDPCSLWGKFLGLFGAGQPRSADQGIGYERVASALFEMETTQPMNQYAFRVDAARDWRLADRAETLWARPGSLGGAGPAAVEPSVDYQDFRIVWELGGPKFSTKTVIPIRVVDPTVNANTAGLSDMELVTKTVLLDGESWQITQLFRSRFNTGAAGKGLSTGHISLEPGFLTRYKWSELTYLHGELSFLFPIAGHPSHSGEIVRWGLGVSHLIYDSDSFAVMPTAEFVFMSILDGEKANPNFGGIPILPVDGECISNVHLGVRLVSDSSCDFGLWELGVSTGIDMGSTGWYNGLLRIESRWVY